MFRIAPCAKWMLHGMLQRSRTLPSSQEILSAVAALGRHFFKFLKIFWGFKKQNNMIYLCHFENYWHLYNTWFLLLGVCYIASFVKKKKKRFFHLIKFLIFFNIKMFLYEINPWRVFVCLFLFLRATLAVYGSSQARGRIRAAACCLHHSHNNARSKLCLWPTL